MSAHFTPCRYHETTTQQPVTLAANLQYHSQQVAVPVSLSCRHQHHQAADTWVQVQLHPAANSCIFRSSRPDHATTPLSMSENIAWTRMSTSWQHRQTPCLPRTEETGTLMFQPLRHMRPHLRPSPDTSTTDHTANPTIYPEHRDHPRDNPDFLSPRIYKQPSLRHFTSTDFQHRRDYTDIIQQLRFYTYVHLSCMMHSIKTWYLNLPTRLSYLSCSLSINHHIFTKVCGIDAFICLATAVFGFNYYFTCG